MNLTGSMVAIVTPMQPKISVDAQLDENAFARLLEFHIEQGTHAIVCVGTTGESATLMEKEHCDIIRRTVEIVAGRLPVIAGTGANSTIEAITLTKCAKKVGADACLLVTPYYNKPTQEGLYQHYKAVATEVDIPQILYNVPSRTACDMLPETVARLAVIDNIIGLKEASADLARITALREQCGDDFLLFSGDDATAREFMLLGGDGVISVTANIAPKAMSEMAELALQGDHTESALIDKTLAGLHQDLFIESNPIPVKWALHEMGFIAAGIRLPLTWLSAECESTVKTAMQQANIL